MKVYFSNDKETVEAAIAYRSGMRGREEVVAGRPMQLSTAVSVCCPVEGVCAAAM